jgi:3-oxoacyl-[acyl-carrier protein] reductase|tara:strand:+ start:1325 stop:2086 length:762 start_codon:yes stop_codon:yes gene_type:complete
LDLGLKNKTALITGASRGIGFAVAECLANENCNLHLVATDRLKLESAKKTIEKASKINISTQAVDLSIESELSKLSDKLGEADILINNAGAIPRGGLEDIDDKTLRKAWELKLFGYINLSRMAFNSMRKRRSGVILNIIGAAARNPTYNYIAGSVANVALENFTIAMGKESTKHGVRILGVHPAITDTDRMVGHYEKTAESKFGDKSRWREVLPPLPFDRPTTPLEVANLVTFLVSKKASYSSGIVVDITGGI